MFLSIAGSRMLIPPLISTQAEESKPKDSEDTSRDKSKGVTSLLRPEIYNELSPLMTTMLEDELKNIMIKVNGHL